MQRDQSYYTTRAILYQSKMSDPRQEEDSDEESFKDVTQEEMKRATNFPKIKSLQNELTATFVKKTKVLTMQQVTHRPQYTTPKKKLVSVSMKVDMLEKYPFLRIKLRDFKMGGQGKVFLAEHLATETLFALKFISLNEVVAENIGMTVKHEIQIGTRPFRNKNLLQMRTFFFQKTFLILVLEYCPLGDLYRYVKGLKNERMEESKAKYIVWTIANALKYMHSKHIMHRDLKPGNVLLQYLFWQDLPPCTEENKLLLRKTLLELENKAKILPKIGNFMRNMKDRILSFFPGRIRKLTSVQIAQKKQFITRLKYLDYPQNKTIVPKNFIKEVVPKISDFGWSTHTHRGRKTTQCGTLVYMAPEVLFNTDYGFEVDVWAIGVIAHEIVAGFNPFVGQCESDVMMKIIKRKIAQPRKISSDAWSFIKLILHAPESKRPSLDVVLQHRWLADIQRMMMSQKLKVEAKQKKKEKPAFKKNYLKKNIQKVGNLQFKRAQEDNNLMKQMVFKALEKESQVIQLNPNRWKI